METEIVVPKAWRSELVLFFLYAISGLASIGLSYYLPQSILYGPLFSFSSKTTIYLGLPIFWLIPATFAGWVIYRVFDVRYALTALGVQSIKGRISLNQMIHNVRYEDIRSLEVRQSVIGRLLDCGDVLIGTAGTSDLEAVLHGIYAPREVQEMIQRERKLRGEGQDLVVVRERYEREAIGSE